jgi:AbrB family looped-hinge helix DNA binding protein
VNSSITVKGQVTIPKAMRDYLGLAPGDQVEFAYLEDGALRVTAAARKRKPKAGKSAFAAARGRLKGRARTDELMQLLRGYDADAKDPGFR